MTTDYRVELLYQPGRWLPRAEREDLVAELRDVAATCFDEGPEYQCLEARDDALDDKLIAVARRRDGRMAGFCSALRLDVPGVGEVLHLGLTCLRPDARSGGLTTRLTSRLLVETLLLHRPLRTTWISNVACVLSSLGNVALHFDAVYPSPFGPKRPSPAHLRIARAIARHHRRDVHIAAGAVLDEASFVFRGSVPGTVFQKDDDDRRYFHRDGRLNDYYRRLMRFERGDEVVQIGRFGVGTLARFALGRMPLGGWRRAGARPAFGRAA
jgi:hypothetical protein